MPSTSTVNALGIASRGFGIQIQQDQGGALEKHAIIIFSQPKKGHLFLETPPRFQLRWSKAKDFEYWACRQSSSSTCDLFVHWVQISGGSKGGIKLGGSKDPFSIWAYFLYPTYLFIPPFEPPENWVEKKEKQLLVPTEAYAGHASPATVNNTVARVTNTNFRGGCTVLSETPSQQIVPTSGLNFILQTDTCTRACGSFSLRLRGSTFRTFCCSCGGCWMSTFASLLSWGWGFRASSIGHLEPGGEP